MRTLAYILLATSMAACSSGTGYKYQTALTPAPGLTKVTLNSELQIRPDRASEYIQYGEVKERSKVIEYYPHCIFELRTVSETARTVQPETFTVTSIHRDRFTAGYRKLLLASAGGDYNMLTSTTTISLQSAHQPDVFRLSCKQLDEPYRARHVTVEQMRKTLGEMFTLE